MTNNNAHPTLPSWMIYGANGYSLTITGALAVVDYLINNGIKAGPSGAGEPLTGIRYAADQLTA